MFSIWKQEKETAAIVGEAHALSHRLADAKPHFVESHAAAARFWAAFYLASGQNLYELISWTPDAVARFSSTAQTKIAALRKKREYDSSDGLTVWLHTARAVTEPRIVPAALEIWCHLSNAGPNADSIAQDLIQDAGLPTDDSRRVPKGFSIED